MSSTFEATAMAADKEKLRAAPIVIAATFFFSLAISVHFINPILANPKRKKSCYLNSESKPQHKFKRVLADNSYSQFKHLKLHVHAADSISEGINNIITSHHNGFRAPKQFAKKASQEQGYVNILEDAEHSSSNISENTAPCSADTDDAASGMRSYETSGSGDLSNETTNPLEDKDILLKHGSKMSLLGHGPHGKKVVEYLLKEYGEDGVRDFVSDGDRFSLKHSGKTDFGEFSVYNPTNQTSAAAAATAG